MRGEQFLINQKVLEHPENPIKNSIGELTPEDIIEVIEKEYWNEWQRLISHAETSSIYCRNIGKFYVGYSQLRGHMWGLLAKLKSIRKRLKTFVGSDEKKQEILESQENYRKKFRACWKQWDEQRKMFILRTLNWNDRLRKKGEESRIKCHYEQWNWSFTK